MREEMMAAKIKHVEERKKRRQERKQMRRERRKGAASSRAYAGETTPDVSLHSSSSCASMSAPQAAPMHDGIVTS
jgi:hypothetical protein